MNNKYSIIMKTPFVRMLVVTAIIGTIGASLYNIVLVQYAAKLPYADTAVLIVSISGMIPYLLQSIPGRLADETRNQLKSLYIASLIQSMLFLILAVLVTNQNWYLLIIVVVINLISDILELYNSGLVAVLQQRYVTSDLMETTTGLIRSSALLISIIGQTLGVMILTVTHYNFSILALINAITFALVAFVVGHQMSSNTQYISESLTQDNNEYSVDEQQTSDKINFWRLMKQIFQASPKLFVAAAFLANFLSASLIPLINVGLLHQVNRVYSYAVSVLIVSLAVTIGNLFGSFFSDMLFKHKIIIDIIILSNLTLILFFISFFIFQLELISYFLLFAFSLISGVSNVKISVAIMDKVPSIQLASFFTSYSSLMYLAMPIGMTLIPSIALLGNNISAVILISLTITMILMIILSKKIYQSNPDTI